MARRVEEDFGVDARRLAILARRLAARPVGAGWWPFDDPFTIALSAVLTQQTRWEAAAAGVERLRERGLLDPHRLAAADRRTVEAALRVTGFYRQKAKAVRGIARRLNERYGGAMDRALSGPLKEARQELLEWPGVGPETADAILLFAGRRPVFVVDAYTRRLMARYGALRAGAGRPPYAAVQRAWHEAVPPDAARYAKLHAAIVDLSKSHCRKTPVCAPCPLREGCAHGRAAARRGQGPRRAHA